MASIFTKILNKEIPSEILFENDNVFVIKDINPVDKTHLLIIPKQEIPSINDLEENHKEIMWDMLLVAKKMAEKFNVKDWYKLIINAWDYQEVPHIHMHLISNRG